MAQGASRRIPERKYGVSEGDPWKAQQGWRLPGAAKLGIGGGGRVRNLGLLSTVEDVLSPISRADASWTGWKAGWLCRRRTGLQAGACVAGDEGSAAAASVLRIKTGCLSASIDQQIRWKRGTAQVRESSRALLRQQEREAGVEGFESIRACLACPRKVLLFKALAAPSTQVLGACSLHLRLFDESLPPHSMASTRALADVVPGRMSASGWALAPLSACPMQRHLDAGTGNMDREPGLCDATQRPGGERHCNVGSSTACSARARWGWQPPPAAWLVSPVRPRRPPPEATILGAHTGDGGLGGTHSGSPQIKVGCRARQRLAHTRRYGIRARFWTTPHPQPLAAMAVIHAPHRHDAAGPLPTEAPFDEAVGGECCAAIDKPLQKGIAPSAGLGFLRAARLLLRDSSSSAPGETRRSSPIPPSRLAAQSFQVLPARRVISQVQVLTRAHLLSGAVNGMDPRPAPHLVRLCPPPDAFYPALPYLWAAAAPQCAPNTCIQALDGGGEAIPDAQPGAIMTWRCFLCCLAMHHHRPTHASCRSDPSLRPLSLPPAAAHPSTLPSHPPFAPAILHPSITHRPPIHPPRRGVTAVPALGHLGRPVTIPIHIHIHAGCFVPISSVSLFAAADPRDNHHPPSPVASSEEPAEDPRALSCAASAPAVVVLCPIVPAPSPSPCAFAMLDTWRSIQIAAPRRLRSAPIIHPSAGSCTYYSVPGTETCFTPSPCPHVEPPAMSSTTTTASTTVSRRDAASSPSSAPDATSSSVSLPSDKEIWPAAASMPDPDPIKVVPPPWTLNGDVYCISWWTSGAAARKLPKHAYSPLEAGTDFANPPGSHPVGGLSMIQIIRYRDSPVGPYDELLVVPGSFDWSRDGPDGRREVGRNPRITRIYVSQKHTCYNGRVNWNCPKHLARFDWDYGPNDSVSVKVYPHDTTDDITESKPSPLPFFQATFKPVSYVPSFPFATRWANYFGFETTLAMPPVPQGEGSQGELPSTDVWCKVIPLQYSRTTRAGWFDMSMRDEKGELIGEYENFWPGMGRWQLGVKMENAELSFDHATETWKPMKSRAHL
ncbi:hypothetical protein PCL_11435 [Purpureocillium lilacinum]|uniref:Uncharacterized protein n=1 Tax=Purpureocillium lilacinum TaxID=33203 RepID=A0A2U3EA16_PURLI|nr:hypothetical protein PCL_11435 [Purpureocillium lilacinum]